MLYVGVYEAVFGSLYLFFVMFHLLVVDVNVLSSSHLFEEIWPTHPVMNYSQDTVDKIYKGLASCSDYKSPCFFPSLFLL